MRGEMRALEDTGTGGGNGADGADEEEVRAQLRASPAHTDRGGTLFHERTTPSKGD